LTAEGPRTSYNIGRIGGGTSVNSIPFESWMEVDMRSESPESLDIVDAALTNAVNTAVEQENAERRRGDEVTVTIDRIGTRPSGSGDEGDPLVQRAIAATTALDRLPSLGRSSTDSNIPISLGIPAITIGGGGGGGASHSLDEWYLNVNGPVGIKRILLISLAQVGMAPVG
jgi:acetylornithine deacetylase/succinyl-diaminopimelate desuccinylase-like protein